MHNLFIMGIKKVLPSKFIFLPLWLLMACAASAQEGFHIGFQAGYSRNSILMPSDFKSDYFSFRGVSNGCLSGYLEYGIDDNFAFKFMVQNNQYGFSSGTKGFETIRIDSTTYTSGGSEGIYFGYLSLGLEAKHRLNILRERVFLTQVLGLSWMNTGNGYEEHSDKSTMGYLTGSYYESKTYSPGNINSFSICAGFGFEFKIFKNKYLALDFTYSSGLKEIAHTENTIHEPGGTSNLRIGNNGTFATITGGVKIPIIIRKKKTEAIPDLDEEGPSDELPE